MNRVRALLSSNPMVVDSAIALGLAALSMLAFVGGSDDVGGSGALTAVLLLLESVPLVWRRRFPVAVLLIVVGAMIVHLLIVPEGESLRGGLGVLVALFTIGERLERRISVALAVLTGAIVGVIFIAKEPIPSALQALIQTEVVFGVAWLVGDGARVRGLYTRAVEERASLLERERTERARTAVLEERERIARELHDAVAHHVSVMVIQAGGGLRALEGRPADARKALESINGSGREALTDMRRMLAMLGDQTDEPMPGLDRLGDLLEQVRAAGLAVELSITGARPKLDAGLEASAYRIIQESLTNSLKHAGGGGRAHVTIRYEPTALHLSIDDERGPEARPSVEPAHDGRGLVGMRERVALFRGTFTAEPTPRGFRVSALLPIAEAS
jgi:signal transduction histidine kinase